MLKAAKESPAGNSEETDPLCSLSRLEIPALSRLRSAAYFPIAPTAAAVTVFSNAPDELLLMPA